MFQNDDHMMAAIREANLTYLMLAQNMIRADRAQALYRLGISEEVAEIIGGLTPAQLMRVASSNMLMCRFRFDDNMVWNLLTSHGKRGTSEESTAQRLHANILMASNFEEAV